MNWHVVWTDYQRIQQPDPHSGPRTDADIGYAHFLWDGGGLLSLEPASMRLENDTDGDQVLEPCEQADLWLGLHNTGTVTLTGVQATITVLSGDMNVVTATSAYDDILPGETKETVTPFVVQLNATHRCGETIEIQVDVSSDQGDLSLTTSFLPLEDEIVIHLADFTIDAQGWMMDSAGCSPPNNLLHWIPTNVCFHGTVMFSLEIIQPVITVPEQAYAEDGYPHQLTSRFRNPQLLKFAID